MAWIYNADTYCDDCGKEIRRRILGEFKAKGQKPPFDPKDEDMYDSDEFPKRAKDIETDAPCHCGNGDDCLNAITLSDSSKVGALIGTLTAEGTEYVRQAIREGSSLVAVEVWAPEFGLEKEIGYKSNADIIEELLDIGDWLVEHAGPMGSFGGMPSSSAARLEEIKKRLAELRQS